MLREERNRISEAIIGAAIAVRRELGPGLLENTYEACLQYELLEKGFKVDRQKELPVKYRGVLVECGFRIDLIVNDLVIVEVKAVERLEKIFDAQLLTYLKLTGLTLGPLMNFNTPKLIDGVKRLVNGDLDT
jgi:GxxExxY protein